jgi:hypothetical protein
MGPDLSYMVKSSGIWHHCTTVHQWFLFISILAYDYALPVGGQWYTQGDFLISQNKKLNSQSLGQFLKE